MEEKALEKLGFHSIRHGVDKIICFHKDIAGIVEIPQTAKPEDIAGVLYKKGIKDAQAFIRRGLGIENDEIN